MKYAIIAKSCRIDFTTEFNLQGKGEGIVFEEDT